MPVCTHTHIYIYVYIYIYICMRCTYVQIYSAGHSSCKGRLASQVTGQRKQREHQLMFATRLGGSVPRGIFQARRLTLVYRQNFLTSRTHRPLGRHRLFEKALKKHWAGQGKLFNSCLERQSRRGCPMHKDKTGPYFHER